MSVMKLKEYLESLELYKVFETFQRIAVTKKLWGYEVWFFNTDTLCMKILVVYPGHSCSDHYHKKKYEIFTCIDSWEDSRLVMILDGKEKVMKRGDYVEIRQGMVHSFHVIGERPCALLELSTQHRENDSFRILNSHRVYGGGQMNFLGRVGDLKGKKVLAIGDLALDEYSVGIVERLSPEAPVPVILNPETRQMPGCVGNVAVNIESLGGECEVVALVGDDRVKIELLALMAELGIGTEYCVTSSTRRTSCKTRFFGDYTSGPHYIVRRDHEDTHDATEEEGALLKEQFINAIEKWQPDVAYFSDYDKGVLSPDVLISLIGHCNSIGLKTIADPKFAHFFDFCKVTILKPNDTRAAVAMEMPNRTESDADALVAAMMEKLSPENIIMTRGAKGMYVKEGDQAPVHIPPAKIVEVSEVSGAGDTAGATLALAVAAGFGLTEAAKLSNLAASIVVQKPGTASCTPAELADAIE